LAKAIVELKEAVRLKPDDAAAHCNLGIALQTKGQVDQAIAEYQEAIRLKEDWAAAHSNLGAALSAKGRLDEAIAEFQQAIALDPKSADLHCNFGQALREQGEFAAALEELRRGHELGSKKPRWSSPSAQWVKDCERLVALDLKLPRILKGEVQPADVGERLTICWICQRKSKKLYAASVRFYSELFTEEPKLADDLQGHHRYNAACAAALAGCGQSSDAQSLDENKRAALRQQARDWLYTDLAAYRRRLEKEQERTGPAVARMLAHWLEDSDFAGVRAAEALARLPEAERKEWQQLWQDVEVLRQRAAAPPK
jgi:tetratricopeptide (TPR) repeat protein